MVELVEQDDLAAADQAGDEAEVGLVAGGEDEAGFLAEELGEVVLQLLVQVEGAVQEAAAGAAGAVLMERLLGRLEDLRVVREAEVVVRAQHDAPLALDDDDRVLGLGDRLEVRVETRSLDFACLGELPALLEEGHLMHYLCVHGASRLRMLRPRRGGR